MKKKNYKKKLVLIDGNALIHRAFHALPPLTTPKGELVNAVFGFCSVLLKAISDLNPTHIIATFDKKGPTFRHKLYKDYKATRQKAPDELYQQIPKVHEVVEAFNIPIFEMTGFEADDLIGTLSKQVGFDNVIVTGDMDALQLVDNDTTVYGLGRGVSDAKLYDEAGVMAKYGLRPEQLIDYKGLRGDPSDNIPGVPGIGEKTAVLLLKEFDDLETLYKKLAVDSFQLEVEGLRGAERIQKLLVENKDNAFLSKKLGTIKLDVPISINVENSVVKDYDRAKVVKLFHELGFKSLLNRLPESVESKPGEQANLFSVDEVAKKDKKIDYDKYVLLDSKDKLEKFVKKLESIREFAFDTETTSVVTMEAELMGISFSMKDGEAYYLPVDYIDGQVKAKLKEIFGNKNIKKIAHNAKYDYMVLKNYGITVFGLYFDSMIASYLLSPGTRSHGLKSLSFTELGYEMMTYDDLVGKGKDKKELKDVDINTLAFYSAEDADYTWRLKKVFAKQIEKDQELLDIFNNVEMPLVFVLAEIEENGVLFDSEFLKKLSKQFEKKINDLTKEIYKLAGTKAFNIKSTQQLSHVLFDVMKISAEGIKKTTTGFSTASPELTKLMSKHDIIPLIEKYRELTKLKSTYLDALPKLVNKKTGRVHTSFNQTVTATGRLSSSDPNLQNIPIRTDVGQQIRKAFIATPGYKLLAADYSQIELRVMAHVSQDKNMIKAFREDKDIHSATASILFGKELDEVTKQDRRIAKTVNFGLLYGMGAYGMAQRLQIDRETAQQFIDNYFKNFSSVQKYIDKTLKFAKKNGYVETETGRKRFVPEINGSGPQVAAAERVAINMPVQGLGADIIKIAMVEMRKKLKVDNTKTILQVHDELVFEVKEDKIREVAKIVKSVMENAYKLDVPLKVDISVGENWGEMRTLKVSNSKLI